jgi:hypothetical protein
VEQGKLDVWPAPGDSRIGGCPSAIGLTDAPASSSLVGQPARRVFVLTWVVEGITT